jgi:hypothetical protein
VTRLLTVILLLAACHRGPAAPPVTVVEPKPGGDPLTVLLAREAQAARSLKLQPYAYLSATWCGPCETLKHSLSEPRMAEALRGAYLIKLDIDGWEPALGPAGLDASTIPAFVGLDAGGRPNGKRIDGAAWGEDTVENMAKALGPFFR